jgi:hypothetical protein
VNLCQREALAGQRGAHNRDVAEVVVYEGTDRALRQPGRRIDHLVPHVLPDDVEVLLLVAVEDLDAHLGLAVSRPGVDVVALGDLGERLLDRAGDQELDVLRLHAGHEGHHHGIAHRDRGILLAREVAEHAEAVSDQRAHQDQDEGLVAECCAGQVHRAFRESRSSSSVTC